MPKCALLSIKKTWSSSFLTHRLQLARAGLADSGLDGALLGKHDTATGLGGKVFIFRPLPPSNHQLGVVTALDVLEHAPLDYWPRYTNLAAFGLRPL